MVKSDDDLLFVPTEPKTKRSLLFLICVYIAQTVAHALKTAINV